MRDTLIIQSHTAPLPAPWLEDCLRSVRDWGKAQGFEYRFIGDELFQYIPAELDQALAQQRMIASDLARIGVLRHYLQQGYETVAWLDADFLIFRPDEFILPTSDHAVGREIWIQNTEAGKLKAYKKVHNALLLFRRGNSFMDFYFDSAARLLRQNQAGMPPQFIGPKLLTALHNVVQLPVMEQAGMLSPVLIKDILAGGGEALNLFCSRSPHAISGANLCISSRDRKLLNDEEISHLIKLLLYKPPF